MRRRRNPRSSGRGGRQYPQALLLGSGGPPSSGAGTVAEMLALLPAPGRDGASLLHVSAHAGARVVPTESLIQLAGGDLTVAAILDQARDRPADAPGGLLVVDACETDVSLAVDDEALTLATSLLAAGAAGVIGTRWSVSDMVSAVFTVMLHDNLRHHPPVEALRRTQLWMLDPDRTPPDGMPDKLLRVMQLRNVAAPRHWAGFTYHGAP